MALTQVAAGLLAGSITSSQITSVSGASLTGTQNIPKATLPTGSVLQVVSVSSTTGTSTTGAGYVQWGQTLSITPTSSTSKILISHFATWYSSSTSNSVYVTLYRNSTNLDLGNGRGFYEANAGTSGIGMPVAIQYLDSPSTTSSTTYSVYFRNSVNNGTFYYNTDGAGATITLMEIAA